MNTPNRQEADGVDRLHALVRRIPDFPQPGICFRDVTPLLADPAALCEVVERLATPFRQADVTAVVGIEARGFIFGAALAMELGTGFVPVRKAGKLPAETFTRSYELEYGSATLELHRDGVGAEDRVLIVDDLLATGGTAVAASELVEEAGAMIVAAAFVLELTALGGRAALAPREVLSLLEY
ncbi:adenine phosphoribosyltransferase [soil metagenome]